MSTEIIKISSDDSIFKHPDYLEDRLIFNYIDGARRYKETEFYSDKKHIIICHKLNNKSVWIWTDDTVYDNVNAVIQIAKTIRDFNTQGLEFFTKPKLAQIFSDMYALVSNELDYQIKSEFSLGAYVFAKKCAINDETVTVQKYNKKFYNELVNFYMELKDEFHWNENRVKAMVKKFIAFDTYLLLKNGEIISVCVISVDDCDYSSIRSVATKTSERNKGYGTLVTNISSMMHTKGNKKLMLYANNGNLSAVSAFKKAGFELIGKVHLIKS